MFRKKPNLRDLLIKSGIDVYCDAGMVLLDALAILGYAEEDDLRDLTIMVKHNYTWVDIQLMGTPVLSIWLDCHGSRNEWTWAVRVNNGIEPKFTWFDSDYDISGKRLI